MSTPLLALFTLLFGLAAFVPGAAAPIGPILILGFALACVPLFIEDDE